MNELPPAATVADMCAMRAWDAIDDDSRLLLEMAADTIREQHRQLLRKCRLFEKVEADAVAMAKVLKEILPPRPDTR